MNRSAVRRCAAALFLISLAPLRPAAAQEEEAALAHARRILAETPLVDTHNDLPWVIREKLGGDVEGYDISRRGRWDTDIPRLREGGVGVQFWSVYVPSNVEPFVAVRAQLEQIDIARRIIAAYPDDLGYADSVASIERQLAAGRIASLLGIEGGHTIGDSLGALRTYYDLGVRYMTLTHFDSNHWADSATGERLHGGLTAFGREVVREMNRLGMMVDLSHVSPETMTDALDTTAAPVIFSHSSTRALTDHVRNVPDAILERLPANRGIVMVTFVPSFVSEPARLWEKDLLPKLAAVSTDAEWQRLIAEHVAEHGPSPRATIADVADHIEHVAQVAGIDHVGIGADFYGAEDESELVQGLEDVSKYPQLFAELIRRGWSDADLRKLAAENLLRVFGEVEAAGERLRATRPPSNARIGDLDGPGAATE